ncbi:MAG: flagellar hook-basal body complex protein [Butyrivibrio sp.]|uniref:flagellar hook protein FlgE n=1 Tax=Butyrivibrio sp. TaxID=28121 RepID=UPI001B00136D|nr:flagellar hook-basal body complex protein [Butyrivibrio sp.]MBO6241074.1 flagellar hook-basal body complex protein [Butyrivibrio sp.]
MMRSLWSGVAGLKTHQLEMDVIGNNIANVNTTAYKSQATGFSDILYQTVKAGTGASDNLGSTNASQVGFGSKVSSINMNITKQGSAVLTDNVFDLMITGDSFFCVSPDVSSGTVNYTRDGSFTIDSDGCLVTQNNGFYVMGVMGDGEITDGVTVEAPLALITDNTKTIAGTATSAAYFSGNIDSEDTNLAEGKALTLEVYGSDGETYSLKFQLTDGGDTEDNTFTMNLSSIQDSSGNTIAFDSATEMNLVYDKHTGRISTINDVSTDTVAFTVTGDASVIGPLSIDFSNTSNYAGNAWTHSSSITGYKGDTEGFNKGYENGEMSGISITDNGAVYARYTNGQTVKIAHIVVAEFNNAMGLEKVGDNLYSASPNSGNPIYMDITSDGGYMSSGVLEGSNVDLAKEFTDMITTQRGFQANSRVITTSDEMLQILRSLKR